MKGVKPAKRRTIPPRQTDTRWTRANSTSVAIIRVGDGSTAACPASELRLLSFDFLSFDEHSPFDDDVLPGAKPFDNPSLISRRSGNFHFSLDVPVRGFQYIDKLLSVRLQNRFTWYGQELSRVPYLNT